MQWPDSLKPILQMTAKDANINQIFFPEFWLATNLKPSIISKSHSLQGEWQVLVHLELQVTKNHRTNFYREKPQTYSETKKPTAFLIPWIDPLVRNRHFHGASDNSHANTWHLQVFLCTYSFDYFKGTQLLWVQLLRQGAKQLQLTIHLS